MRGAIAFIVLTGLGTAAFCAWAVDTGARDAGLAQACEKSAAETVRGSRGALADVSFDAQNARAVANEGALRGIGRYRSNPSAAWRSFSYTCSVDTRNNAASGVVIRDGSATAEPVTRMQHQTATAVVDPDLSALSPEACESSAANALKQRWPGLSQISFDGQSRRIETSAGTDSVLSGRGSAVPTPGAPATFFGYRCSVDVRSGRVTGTRIVN